MQQLNCWRNCLPDSQHLPPFPSSTALGLTLTHLKIYYLYNSSLDFFFSTVNGIATRIHAFPCHEPFIWDIWGGGDGGWDFPRVFFLAPLPFKAFLWEALFCVFSPYCFLQTLRFKNMRRIIYKFAVMVKVFRYFYIPLLILRSNWGKKKTVSKISYSLLCFAYESPGAILRRKCLIKNAALLIIICLFSFSTYWDNFYNCYLLR